MSRNIPCPRSPSGSGRHRWREVAGTAPDHRECKQCGALARVNNNGETKFVSLVEVSSVSVAIRRIG